MDLLSSVSNGSTDAYPATDLDILERSLQSVSDMLDRVLSYVRQVLVGEVKGNAAVGRYLMNTFGASTDELEKGAFNTSLQVSFYVCYGKLASNRPILGYAHGFLPRKPRPLASRSFYSSGSCHRLVIVQKAMHY